MVTSGSSSDNSGGVQGTTSQTVNINSASEEELDALPGVGPVTAQLGTLPILLSVFGQFGLLSVLVNALVLWIVPFVMVFGSLAAIFGLLFTPLGQIFLNPVYPFLLFFEIAVSFFGKSNLVIHSNPLPTAIWIGYYLLFVSFFLLKKKYKKADYPCLVSIEQKLR